MTLNQQLAVWDVMGTPCPLKTLGDIVEALNDEIDSRALEAESPTWAQDRFTVVSNGNEICVDFGKTTLWFSEEETREERGDGLVPMGEFLLRLAFEMTQPVYAALAGMVDELLPKEPA